MQLSGQLGGADGEGTGFGIAILMSCVVAQYVAQTELTRRGYDPEPLSDMTIAALFGGRGNRLLKMQLKWALAPVLLSIGGGYARAWNCQGRGHREA